ncbi:MAG: hypothetical protein U0704_01160 [Candidatus Eisenbacteria bacterium]
MTSPDGGEFWAVASQHAITWTASDNAAVSTVDLAYSTDGGATFPNTIATGLARSGTYTWTIPAIASTQVRVRATAHDTHGNSASDASTITERGGALPHRRRAGGRCLGGRGRSVTARSITHTITASAGANGSITPSGAVGVDNGGSQSFTITPAAHYHIADVLVDGVSVGTPTLHDERGR